MRGETFGKDTPPLTQGFILTHIRVHIHTHTHMCSYIHIHTETFHTHKFIPHIYIQANQNKRALSPLLPAQTICINSLPLLVE